mmetsp:Transcript_28310/g.61516  ORF Transcript_28310/g.61516 Transcript_28310/m.61516 type:complete len:241 (+) Transcript_28310:400-1122(+)
MLVRAGRADAMVAWPECSGGTALQAYTAIVALLLLESESFAEWIQETDLQAIGKFALQREVLTAAALSPSPHLNPRASTCLEVGVVQNISYAVDDGPSTPVSVTSLIVAIARTKDQHASVPVRGHSSVHHLGNKLLIDVLFTARVRIPPRCKGCETCVFPSPPDGVVGRRPGSHHYFFRSVSAIRDSLFKLVNVQSLPHISPSIWEHLSSNRQVARINKEKKLLITFLLKLLLDMRFISS